LLIDKVPVLTLYFCHYLVKIFLKYLRLEPEKQGKNL